MAIASYENPLGKNATRTSCSKTSNLNTFSSMKIDCPTNTSLSSSSSKYNKPKIEKYKSPYLHDDRIQLSRVTEKRVHKNYDFMSSFPLAVNIYKANSDDLRSSKRCTKKVKKSVLTLPNEPAPLPQACTVSDMNDSEYFQDDKVDTRPKPKKRRTIQTKRKSSVKNRQNDYKAKDYWQLDNDFDKCSADMVSFIGSDKKTSNKSQNGDNDNSPFNAHDVWSFLRNVNQLKFKPSPPMSQESSVLSIKKNNRRKYKKQRNNRKDRRLIETCRTEEFAYISSFVDNCRNSCSQSSFDRVTVIEKQDEIQTIKCNRVENEFGKSTISNIFSYSKTPPQNVDITNKSKSKALCAKRNNDKISSTKKLVPAMIQSDDKNLLSKNTKHVYDDFENNRNNFIEMKFNNEIDVIKEDLYRDLDNNSNFSKKSDSRKNSIEKIENKTILSKHLSEKLTSNDSQQHVTGITKVVLSKGQNIFSTKQVTVHQKKSRLVTGNPKITLTLSEIKRRLSSLKFPIVILGKDQLSSTITVENYDPPQFAGLDNHMWPFMRMWYDESYQSTFDSNNRNVDRNGDALNLSNDLKNIKVTNQKIYTDPKVQNYTTKSRYDSLLIKDDKLKDTSAHMKPMRKLKNSMMQFMHIRSPSENKIYNSRCEQKKCIKVTDVGTDTHNHLISTKEENATLRRYTKIPEKKSSINIYAKTKGKRASEFIENIIRKIKNGIYYNQDDFKEQRYNTKEDGVQTETVIVENQADFNYVKADESFVTNEIDSVVSIPGFDNQLSDLEIETLNNFNRVAVKHCVANIIIQFDVALSFENRALQIKQSYPCIPISLVKNQPTIFKCKTTIINAILPAELCSILPKLMKNMMQSNSKLTLPTPNPHVVDKINCNLSTISELNRFEEHSNKYLIPVHIDAKLTTKVAGEGHFSSRNISKEIERSYIELKCQPSFNSLSIKGLLTTVNTNLVPFGHIRLSQLKEVIQSPKRQSTCKVLQPYQFTAKKIMPSHENYSFMRIVETILNSENVRFQLSAALNNNITVVFYKDCLNISFVISNQRNSILKTTIDDLQNGLYDHPASVKQILGTSNLNTYYAPKPITNSRNITCTSKSDKRKSAVEFRINNTRNKKRGFVKLYKKCKSMSSISANRSSINLDKITNLEEFYLALGSGKTLSGVLDGNAERKILSSIKEMKNWITDITPRQALLVLLLANKKDTTNLVRYRLIILQGIAVNRITRASELDMEIEVIERENLNKLTQYEGITYLPASEENQDTLLEELCWIAKTTASDYQKPFDESSERLLKSLLDKRKKLNPSYLRVMARYVGLGLLKTSK